MATNVQIVCDWLERHHGLHRPTSIAMHTGMTPHTAAMTCRYLYEMGRIDRLKVATREGGRAYGLYGVIVGGVRPKMRNPWTDEPMAETVVVERKEEAA